MIDRPLVHVGVGADRGELDRLAGLLDRVGGAVDPRLDVQGARGGDEADRLAGFEARGDRPLAELEPGVVQALADVGQAAGAGVVHGAVGVVGDDRDAGRQRLVDRLVEGVLVDHRERDPVRLGGDRGVRGVDHLGHDRVLGTGPLELAVEQRAGVLGAVLGRGEERVGGDVVDEHELPLRRRREVAGAPPRRRRRCCCRRCWCRRPAAPMRPARRWSARCRPAAGAG